MNTIPNQGLVDANELISVGNPQPHLVVFRAVKSRIDVKWTHLCKNTAPHENAGVQNEITVQQSPEMIAPWTALESIGK